MIETADFCIPFAFYTPRSRSREGRKERERLN